MPPNARQTLKQWLANTWTIEACALLLSILSLVVIIILLSVYDGHPQFQFHGVTLNTVIAILAACVRIGFIVPVSESLAQWKWIWFSREARPLSDFEVIDDASRGSRGSLLLLWETKSLSWTSLGAWVVLLSVATESFIQQLVTFEDKVTYQDDVRVQIPVAQRWSGATQLSISQDYGTSNPTGNHIVAIVDSYGSVTDIRLDFPAQVAINFGLNSDASQVRQQLPVSCPSANCTWPPFLSLAVCSSCSDVSHLVKHVPKRDYPMYFFYPSSPGYLTQWTSYSPEDITSYYLPNGLNLDNAIPDPSQGLIQPPVLLTALSNLAPSKSLTMQSSTTLLFGMSALRVPPAYFPKLGTWQSSDVPLEATECGLHLCVKEYNSQYINGDLIETSQVISSTRNPSSYQVVVRDADTYRYVDGISPAVDALYSNSTYFDRFDLQILVPPAATNRSANKLSAVNITQPAIDALSSYISSLFNDGTYTNVTITTDFHTGCTRDNHPIQCGHLLDITGMAIGNQSQDAPSPNPTSYSPVVLPNLWPQPNSTLTHAMTTRFQTLADSLTNALRQGADHTPSIQGKLGTSRTVLHVRWPWISFPVVLCAVAAAFWVGTGWTGSAVGVPVWKGNATATLCHGLSAEVERRVFGHAAGHHHASGGGGAAGLERLSEMDEAGEEIRVRLMRGTGGGVEDGVLMLREEKGGEGHGHGHGHVDGVKGKGKGKGGLGGLFGIRTGMAGDGKGEKGGGRKKTGQKKDAKKEEEGEEGKIKSPITPTAHIA